MELAKDALDFGLLTDDDRMLAFFESQVGLGAPEPLRVSRDVTQYRFDFMGSIVKVNVVAELPVEARSGYVALVLASDQVAAPQTLMGPDGVRVERVPAGHRGIAQLGARLQVPDLKAAEAYFREQLGWRTADGCARLGRSVVLLEEAPDAPRSVSMPVRGWTYLTVQVFDCDAETQAVVDRGAALAGEPRTLGDVARFSMVADPFGNQLEISERASLTGRPPGRGREPHIG